MTAPAIAASTATAPALTSPSRIGTGVDGLLAFEIAMSMIAVAVLVMAVVGAVAASPALLIASGLIGTASALTGVYTGLNLIA